jgi:hypothetical protein
MYLVVYENSNINLNYNFFKKTFASPWAPCNYATKKYKYNRTQPVAYLQG